MANKSRVDYPAIYFKNDKNVIVVNSRISNTLKKNCKFVKIMYNDDKKIIKITFKTDFELGYFKLRISGRNNTGICISNKVVNNKIKSWFDNPSLIKEIHLAQQDPFDEESWYIVFSSKPIKINDLRNMTFDALTCESLYSVLTNISVISIHIRNHKSSSLHSQIRINKFFNCIVNENEYNEASIDYDPDLKKIVINFKPRFGLFDIKEFKFSTQLFGFTKPVVHKLLLYYFDETELSFDDSRYHFKLIPHPTQEHVYYLEKISELCKIGISDCDENINTEEE